MVFLVYKSIMSIINVLYPYGNQLYVIPLLRDALKIILGMIVSNEHCTDYTNCHMHKFKKEMYLYILIFFKLIYHLK